MLNRQRELTLPRPTTAPTATSCAFVLTLHILWRQASVAPEKDGGSLLAWLIAIVLFLCVLAWVVSVAHKGFGKHAFTRPLAEAEAIEMQRIIASPRSPQPLVGPRAGGLEGLRASVHHHQPVALAAMHHSVAHDNIHLFE